MSFDWNLSSSSSSSDEEDEPPKLPPTRAARQAAAAADAKNDNSGSDDGDEEDFGFSSSLGGDETESRYSSPSATSRTAAAAVTHSASPPPNRLLQSLDQQDMESDSDDEVDWEDAEEEEEPSVPPVAAAAAPSAKTLASLQAVTIDMNNEKKEPAKKKRKRRRRVRMPRIIQHWSHHYHYAYILAETSHAVYLSQLLVDAELLCLAHSMLRRQDIMNTDTDLPPTVAQLKRLLAWFHDLTSNLVSRRHERARANRQAGAPRQRGRTKQQATQPTSIRSDLVHYASHLSSTYDEDPQLWLDSGQAKEFQAHQHVAVLLFVALTRSLGWRTRLVLAHSSHNRSSDYQSAMVQRLDRLCRWFTGGSRAKKKKHKKESAGHPIKQNDSEPPKKQKEDSAEPPKKKQKRATAKTTKKAAAAPEQEVIDLESGSSSSEPRLLVWAEVLCDDSSGRRRRKDKTKLRWVHTDPMKGRVDGPDLVEREWKRRASSKKALAYVTAVEHRLEEEERFRITDVTRRYAHSWVASLKSRGAVRSKHDELKDPWWTGTLKRINEYNSRPAGSARDPVVLEEVEPASPSTGLSQEDAICVDDDDDSDRDKKMPAKPAADTPVMMDEVERQEHEELEASGKDEALPTSKAAFKTHPLYVIASVLNTTEVLAPDASQRTVGVFKGELVYRRKDVSTVLTAKRWLYKGRKVRDTELERPVKRLKARKKPAKKGFQQLASYGVGTNNDGSEAQRSRDIAEGSKALEEKTEDSYYAHWQTDAWSPAPVGPGDPIPVNEFKNVELELINPGLVHIARRGLAPVAKQLGIPYAPCLVGFEGHGGNRTPSIVGIVVHQHNEQLIREASVEVTSHAIEEEHENRRKIVRRRWKKLMIGLLTKDRIEREYS